MDLSGHRALITGAGQGIGRACAENFASLGADLVLLDRNPETLEELSRRLSETGRNVEACIVDLTDLDGLRIKVEELAQRNLIDILVNNAGFDLPGTTAKINPTDFEAVIRIHLTVPFLLIKLLLPSMKSAGWGRIINVSSIYGLIGGKGEVAYSTAKAGVIGLTKSVAKEAGKSGVTVNAVAPGLTRTPTIETFMSDKFKEMIIAETPLARIAEPLEVAKVITFLASDYASYLTGTCVPVSGGWGI